jgi:glucosamine-6-phosphate deaminase
MRDLFELPVERLHAIARVPFRLLQDIPSVLSDFAHSIAGEIESHNRANLPTVLILPVGPVRQYPILVDLTHQRRICWRNVHIFQMDEFLDWQGRPIPTSHPLSFTGFLERELIAKIDPDLRPPLDHLHVPSPFDPDRVSRELAALGGADVCYGGVGYHGHIAFNEPPLSRWHTITVDELRHSLTRIVTLGADSIVVQSILCAGGACEDIPPMAITLGMRDILAARKIRLYLAGGERHRAVFRRTVAGDPSIHYPATLVQSHPDAQLITDTATAAPIHPSLL